MELLLVVIVVAVLFLVAVGQTVWLWVGVLAAALMVGRKTYRVRCGRCHEKALTAMGMRFCNQCGAEQPASRLFRLRCASCGRLARSELNLNHCNRCGFAVKGP